MATLTVRDLADEIVAVLGNRAAEHGRSVEAEHREILREALAGSRPLARSQVAERLAKFRRLTGGRGTISSVELLKESRSEV